MSDANRVRLSYEAETSFGVLPGTVALKEIRLTSETLALTTNTTQSQELRFDRQIGDLVRNGINAGGEINFEWSYGAFDELLQYAIQFSTAWGTETPNTGTFSVSAGGQITGTGCGTGIDVGDWVQVKDGTDLYYGRCTADAGNDDITIQPWDSTVITGDADEETLKSADIYNGITLTTLGIEREYTDLATEFVQYDGMGIDTFSLNVQPDQIVTGSMGFLGKTEVSNTVTIDTAGGPDAAAANSVQNGIDNVYAIIDDPQGTTPTSISGTQFSFSLSNNLRNRLQIGTLGPISLGVGTIGATGTFQGYYEDKTLFDKYINFENTGMSIIFEDSSTNPNSYIIEFPRVKFSSGQRVAQGINSDVIRDINFTAFRDPDLTNPETDVTGTTVRIGRWPGS